MLAAFHLPAQCADAGYAAKASTLFEHPGSPAKTLAQLTKNQPVQILGREGGWARVAAGHVTGWVRLADLRLHAEPSATSRKRGSAAQKDSGIRGFSEEELLVGAPNQAEGERLRRVGVSAGDATSFARAANLRARRQDYIQMQDYMPEGGFPDGFFDE
ncbi:MAG: SH3 domain-containing protein [Betaproteobacteria bacterium]